MTHFGRRWGRERNRGKVGSFAGMAGCPPFLLFAHTRATGDIIRCYRSRRPSGFFVSARKRSGSILSFMHALVLVDAHHDPVLIERHSGKDRRVVVVTRDEPRQHVGSVHHARAGEFVSSGHLAPEDETQFVRPIVVAGVLQFLVPARAVVAELRRLLDVCLDRLVQQLRDLTTDAPWCGRGHFRPRIPSIPSVRPAQPTGPPPQDCQRTQPDAALAAAAP